MEPVVFERPEPPAVPRKSWKGRHKKDNEQITHQNRVEFISRAERSANDLITHINQKNQSTLIASSSQKRSRLISNVESCYTHRLFGALCPADQETYTRIVKIFGTTHITPGSVPTIIKQIGGNDIFPALVTTKVKKQELLVGLGMWQMIKVEFPTLRSGSQLYSFGEPTTKDPLRLIYTRNTRLHLYRHEDTRIQMSDNVLLVQNVRAELTGWLLRTEDDVELSAESERDVRYTVKFEFDDSLAKNACMMSFVSP